MANAVQTKLQKISGDYSAKVAAISKLKADKRKPFLTDAQIKSINIQIKKLDIERLAINSNLTRLTKLAKTAEEYLDINKKLKELEASIAKADSRGESTTSFKSQRTGLVSRLKIISSGVEKEFPEIKVIPPKIVVTTKKPIVTTKKPVVVTTKKTGVFTTPKTGVFTTPKTGVFTTPKTGVVTTKKTGVFTTPKTGVVTTKKSVVTTKKSVVTTKKSVLTTKGTVVTTKTPSNLETLLKKTEFWYDLPDYIFKLEPKLGELLVRAVDEGWDPNTEEGKKKFLAVAETTPWWRKNAPALRLRIIEREKYKDLREAGENPDNTEYGLYLKKQIGAVKAKARELAGVTLTDEQAQSVAEKIYDGFLDDDPLAINALIIPFIGKVSSIAGTGTGAQNVTAYSGQALQAYQTLQSIAKANGFSLKDILPGISTSTTGGDLERAVLQGLAAGTIDINRVAQDARVLAGQGQPQYVRNLLNQGYDLENVYAPYKRQMATDLEINPDMIDLNDPTLRSAITDKGDMNLFDFKRTIRQDDRWQYTQSARDEVSSGALKVLQDFGFTG